MSVTTLALPEATIVNPYDEEAVAAAIHDALELRPDDARNRMRALRERARTQDVDAWRSTYGVSYYNCWDEEYYRLQQVQFRHIASPYVGVFWDWKPSADWSFHAEADNIWGFVYTDTRFNYLGPRNAFPVDNVDRYAAQSRPYVELTIRHTF